MHTPPETLKESSIESLPLLHRGKVRDIYEVDARHLLIVTTDRISAFDIVLPTAIPGKGEVLTALSQFWFSRTSDIVPNHLQLAERSLEDALPDDVERSAVQGRAVVVRRLRPLPIEAIVRGYIIGSGWKDYTNTGRVCGIELPPGLALADRLAEPIYTPSSKAEIGQHDENIDYRATAQLVGDQIAAAVRDAALQIYRRARDYARERGIIIADTKFEFGVDERNALVLIDEALTPDSSRFWPADQWHPGASPPSFDKQFVRDYLDTLDWDKRAPAPELPAHIVRRTAEKYRDAQQRLSGA